MNKDPIIIAIEDAITALDVQSLIRGQGFKNTVICHNCNETCDSIISSPPLLLVVDISLDDQDNWLNLIEYVNGQHLSPVIAITSSSAETLYCRIREIGVSSIITKPFDRDVLQSEIISALN